MRSSRSVGTMQVWVEDWQMQCCGDPFAVGDAVCWMAVRSAGMKEVDSILGLENGTSIEWVEDHHDLADTEPLSAIVQAIQAVFYRFRLADRAVVPIMGSGVLIANSHATGWGDESEDVKFLGYIVTLTPAQALSVGSDGDVGEVAEGRCIGSEDDTSGGSSRGADDEVMRAAGPASPTHGGEQFGVHGGDMKVVVDDGDRRDDRLDELLTTGTFGARRKLDADA